VAATTRSVTNGALKAMAEAIRPIKLNKIRSI
jgi:hypothetical protein